MIAAADQTMNQPRQEEVPRADPAGAGSHAPPSERELLALSLLSAAVLWTTVLLSHRSLSTVISHGHLFGWPFHGIVAGMLAHPAPWSNLLLSCFWIGLVLAGVGMMFTRSFREYARTHPNEAIFCGLYLLATFSYDYLIWARSNFIRFCIPALPFVFYALSRFLPKDRRILWALGVLNAVAAALSAIGVRNVIRIP